MAHALLQFVQRTVIAFPVSVLKQAAHAFKLLCGNGFYFVLDLHLKGFKPAYMVHAACVSKLPCPVEGYAVCRAFFYILVNAHLELFPFR